MRIDVPSRDLYGPIKDHPFDPAALAALTEALSDKEGWRAAVDSLPPWLSDQYQATVDEMSEVSEAMFPTIATRTGYEAVQKPADAHQLALVAYAIARHVRARCLHIGVMNPGVLTVLLDRGWAGCRSCAQTKGGQQRGRRRCPVSHLRHRGRPVLAGLAGPRRGDADR